MHKRPRHFQLKAKAQLRLNISQIHHKTKHALRRFPPPKKLVAAIGHATTAKRVTGFLPMSNTHVRGAAGLAMIKALQRHQQQINRDPSVRTFLLTATFDDGIIPVNASAIPLHRIQRKVRSALQMLQLQGVCVFDIDVIRKPKGELSRLLLVHVHAVCWTRDPSFSVRAAENKLTALRRFRNRLGVPSITLRSRAESITRHRFDIDESDCDQTTASMGYLGYYLTKACVGVKRRFRRKSGSFTVKACAGAFGPKMVLRLASIWAQISPFDAVFAIGPEGSAVAANYAKRVRWWAKKRRSGEHFSDADLRSSFRRYFTKYPAIGLTPMVVAKRPAT